MRRLVIAFAMTATLWLMTAVHGNAQTWTGGYVGGSIGGVVAGGHADETVIFDTDLNGTFADTVRTGAGANAFSPGFCGGLAVNAVAANGCTDDDAGMDVSGRAGYDWQWRRLVFGGLADIGRVTATDSVSAFSTTPAFYSFTRDVNMLAAFRGRVGLATQRLLVYGTAGAVSAGLDLRFTTSNAVNTFVPRAESARPWGSQAGGGVEFRVAGHWTVIGEYLWTSIDDRERSTVRSQGPAPATNPFLLVNAAGTDLQRAERLQFHSLRAGLSYRF